eukprot:1697430-Rhodomonas_salina.1
MRQAAPDANEGLRSPASASLRGKEEEKGRRKASEEENKKTKGGGAWILVGVEVHAAEGVAEEGGAQREAPCEQQVVLRRYLSPAQPGASVSVSVRA